MKKCVLMLTVLFFSLFASVSIYAQNRFALVIGNSEYEHIADLKNPVRDAVDIARNLRELGFDVMLEFDINIRTFDEVLHEFGEKLSSHPNNEGFLWYAGHGGQIEGENFLFATDVNIDNESQVKRGSVSLNDLLKTLSLANNMINVIVLDACRDNPLPASTVRSPGGGVSRGLAVLPREILQLTQSMYIIYSTASGSIADDGAAGARNSPFTTAFMAHMAKPLTFEEMIKDVSNDVIRLGNGQRPYIEGSILAKNYSLNPQGLAALSGVELSPPPASPFAVGFREQLRYPINVTTSIHNPITVKLSPITFTNAEFVPEGMVGWGEINAVVKEAQKYVILDLSDCTADGNTVTGADDWVFPLKRNDMNIIKDNPYITGLILPSNLETIGKRAFQGCSHLTSVSIPAGIRSIGQSAFSNCSGLTNVFIPGTVTEIKTGAFGGCINLASIDIPAGVTSIEKDTFGQCTKLSSISIPANISSIGHNAFYDCLNLLSVRFEGNNVEIDTFAFTGNLKNEYTRYGDGSYTREARSGVWKTEQSDTGISEPEMQPASFYNANEIIPAVLKLPPLTFTNAEFVPEGMIGWGEINAAILDAKEYVILDLSDCTADGDKIIGRWSFQTARGNDMNIMADNPYIKGIILPSSLKTIGEWSFENCVHLESIILPDGLMFIDYYCFVGCINLRNVIIPGSVTSIGIGVFAGCLSLTNIEIPDRVYNVDLHAFFNCRSLKSVIIGEAVSFIGGEAFRSCDELTSITFRGDNVAQVKPGAFASSYDIPSNTLRDLYLSESGGQGIYTRTAGHDDWVKQQ